MAQLKPNNTSVFLGSTQNQLQEFFKDQLKTFTNKIFDMAQHKPIRDSTSLPTSLIPKERLEERVPISTHKPNSQKCFITKNKNKEFNACIFCFSI